MDLIFGRSNEELRQWKSEIFNYEKCKRTKKPFGQSLPKVERVTHAHIKERQTIFDPVKHKYRKQQDEIKSNTKDEIERAKSLHNYIRHTNRYQRDYDIINLHGSPHPQTSPNPKKLGPIRNIYNVVNNQIVPEYYYHNRDLKLPVEKHRVVLEPKRRDYDLVSGTYKQNNQERQQQQSRRKDQQIYKKYHKAHDYDPVFGKYYDEQKQLAYQEELKSQMKQHGKHYNERFPPSYVQRQSYIPDLTKPLPESIRLIDQKNLNAKKRYKLKYIIEDEYEKRNREDEQKQASIIKNRVHNTKVLQQKYKQFDIITMKKYQPIRAEQLYNKKTVSSTWDRLEAIPIKSSGFQ